MLTNILNSLKDKDCRAAVAYQVEDPMLDYIIEEDGKVMATSAKLIDKGTVVLIMVPDDIELSDLTKGQVNYIPFDIEQQTVSDAGQRIINELSGRKHFDGWWGNIDEDIQAEIITALTLAAMGAPA